MNGQPDFTAGSEKSIIEKIENSFDWNLIALVSIWVFLLATFFLLFVG
ncbi:MAG TPA: hypothetical protein PKN29_10845 [Candidatus Ozemobacteraceae bacterium]|nr:hypothetical protein [Candidatus Ozemobacteraceae bacterium]